MTREREEVMKRRTTAILLTIGLSLTAVLSSACGASQSGGAAPAEPAAEETAEEPAAEEQVEEEPAAEETAPAAEEPAAETAPAAEEQPAVQVKTSQSAPAAVSGKFHCELTQVGSFEDDGSYLITYDSLLHGSGETYTFCAFDGSEVDSRALFNMDYLGWDLYTVSLQGDDINTTGLVTTDGEVIIPFDAAILAWPSEAPSDRQPRYILVITGTETTEDQSEALFYVTDRQFAISANDDDIFYKGTLRVFDLEARQYVPGLEFTQGTSTSFAQIGDNIYTDLTGADTVYAPDGTVAYTTDGYLYYNKDYLEERKDTTSVIMDANGKPLYRTEDSISAMSYDSPYFQLRKDQGYIVIDSAGNTVLGTPYYTIYGESLGRFRVKNDGDNEYSLVTADNTVIAKAEYIYEADELGFFAFGDSGNYTLITPDNRIYEGLSGNTSTLVFTTEDNTFLTLNTGEFAQAPGTYLSSLVKGTVSVENDDRRYGLYDVFTGEELLGFDYDQIRSLNDDYVYAVKGSTFTIYKVDIIPD